MDKIQVKLINKVPEDVIQIACNMTRGANRYDDIDTYLENRDKWDIKKINSVLHLPHSKLARFIPLQFLVFNASRRFLSQMITHHIGCDIMSGSLQYSDHSKRHLKDMFVVPYNMLAKAEATGDRDAINAYLEECNRSFEMYESLRQHGVDNDNCGYVMPMGMRNVLLIQVNLEELMCIAKSRLCRRNSEEIRYVVGIMIEQLKEVYDFDDDLFMPSCCTGVCKEGLYTCGCPIHFNTVTELLDFDFKVLRNARKGN